jgi:tape measure domain-containing protein
MPGPIDTAYVEFEAHTEKLERESLTAFDEVVNLAKHVAEQVDRAFGEMTTQVVSQFDRMRRDAGSAFDQLANRGRADLGQVEHSTRQVSESVTGLTSRMSTAVSTMAGFVGGNIVMSGLSRAYAFAKDAVVGFNSTLQNSNIAFTTMLGSAQAATKFIQDLQTFAKKTPFEFQGLVQNAQRMLGMGVAARDIIPDLRALGDSVASVGGSAEQVDQVTLAFDQMVAKGTLDMGNMNQLLQGGVPNALRILADSYKVTTGQMIEMISTGKVQSADALPKLIAGLENGTKSVAALGGMMDKQSATFTGALSNIADGLQQAIAGAFRPFFNVVARGALQLGTFFSSTTFEVFGRRISTTLSNAMNAFGAFVHGVDWSPLINAIMTLWHIITDDLVPAGQSVIATFGPLLMAGFRAAMGGVAALVDQLRPFTAALRAMMSFVEQHKTTFQALAVGILAVVGAMKVYAAVQATAAAATKLWAATVATWNTVVFVAKAATEGWTTAMVALDLAMDANPIGIIILAVVALVAAIAYLWTHSDAFRKFFIGVWNDIWGFLKSVGAWFAGPFAHFFIDTWNDILGFFRSVGAWFAGPFVNFFVNAWHEVLALPSRILAALRALPGQLRALFETALQRLAYMVGFAVGTIVRYYLELPGRLWNITTQLWSVLVNLVQAGVSAVIEFFRELPGRAASFVISMRERVVSIITSMWNTGVSLFERGVSRTISFLAQLPGRVWGIIVGLPGMVWNALSGLGSMLWGIGENMIRSLIGGISHLLGWAVDQAKRAAGNIARGFMDALGISSPSKVFVEIGRYTVQGYTSGIEDEMSTAHAAVRRIISPPREVTNVTNLTESKTTNSAHHGFSGTVIVNVGGRQVEGTIVDILYDNTQHVALASRQGERKLVGR